MNHRRLFPSLLILLAGLLSAGPSDAQSRPVLILDVSMQTSAGVPLVAPLGFASGAHTITAIAFSFDLDSTGLTFDPTDTDLDGVPDAVTLPAGVPAVVVVDYDPTEPDGEIDVLLANLSGAPLAEGVILELELTPNQSGTAASWISFSENPEPSFANDQGADVCGSARVLGSAVVFSNGFESGDTCAWSGSQP